MNSPGPLLDQLRPWGRHWKPLRSRDTPIPARFQASHSGCLERGPWHSLPARGHSSPLVSRLDARWLGSSFHFLTLK